MHSTRGGQNAPTSRKRKNAARSPPPSDRQTRNQGAKKSSNANNSSVVDETAVPERPPKRPRPRSRVKNTGGRSLDVIVEDSEVEDLAAKSSPAATAQSAAEILVGISSSNHTENLNIPELTQVCFSGTQTLHSLCQG